MRQKCVPLMLVPSTVSKSLPQLPTPWLWLWVCQLLFGDAVKCVKLCVCRGKHGAILKSCMDSQHKHSISLIADPVALRLSNFKSTAFQYCTKSALLCRNLEQVKWCSYRGRQLPTLLQTLKTVTFLIWHKPYAHHAIDATLNSQCFP